MNYKKLIGTPDIVLAKYNIAIFVDGEFWHGKDFESFKSKAHNNKSYWIEKITENIDHDAEVTKHLQQEGWNVIRFWSNDVIHHVDSCVKIVEDYIFKI